MTISPTQLDSQECGYFDRFDKNTDVLVVPEGYEAPEGIMTIVVKGIRRCAVVRASGGYNRSDWAHFETEYD